MGNEKVDSLPSSSGSKGKIIGVISLKGGVGKTSSVSNLGAVMASEFGKKVLLIDANFTAPNLGLHLGLVEPENTIHDAMLGKVNIAETIYEHDSGFHFIPGAYVSRKIKSLKLKDKIKGLREHYDMILIDSSPNLNEEILSTTMASDELLVVTSPDYPTLSTTLRTLRLVKQKRTPITGLILNRVRNKKYELSVEDIEDAAQIPVVGVLPEDSNVSEALARTMPVALHRPKSKTSVEYKKLAACLIGETYKDPRVWQNIKSLFKKDLSKEKVNRLLLENERK